MTSSSIFFFGCLIAVGCIVGCDDALHEATSPSTILGEAEIKDELVHPQWAISATIYEVNVRQHTVEGTFRALEADLPRLKNLGSDILWLMPIHPIGEVNRKGGENANNYMVEPGSSSLGSPYSVSDYYAVNSDLGSFDDFKRFVDKAHMLGMRVILDWVANHTAFDSQWTESHRGFFLLDDGGNLQPPTGTDWWDVTQLDWENGQENGLYDAMADAMEFWVREANVDGYRCDVAGKVPTEFWDKARRQLEQVKPDVFMLAEAEVPAHHDRAFDMSYAWHMHHVMNEVAQGHWPVDSIRAAVDRDRNEFGMSAFRMMFVTNHDENSWNGTVEERMGLNGDAMAVLCGTLMGMPLVYSGQEAGNSKRLRFFEKDTIDWGVLEKEAMYRFINRIHHEEPALWNGLHGGWPEWIDIPYSKDVIAWRRTQGESTVVVAVNLGDDAVSLHLQLSEAMESVWGEVPAGESVEIPGHSASVWTQS